MNIVLLFAITVVGILGVCSGLNCYDCQYKRVGDAVSGQNECKDDLSKTKLTTCGDLNYQHCGLFEVKPDETTEIIIRSCVLEGTAGLNLCRGNVGSPWPDFYQGSGRLCVCDGNNCNIATGLAFFTILPIIFGVLSLILF